MPRLRPLALLVATACSPVTAGADSPAQPADIARRLEPPAPAASAPSATSPSPVDSARADDGSPPARGGPDVRVDPDAPLVVGPAGAMRRVPGPSADGAGRTDSPPFDEVRHFLGETRRALVRCYANALKSNPDARGTIGFRVTFSTEGRVTRVDVVRRDGAFSDDLTACVSRVLAGLSIGPGDGPREIVIPLVLTTDMWGT